MDENNVEVNIPEKPSDEISTKNRAIHVKEIEILYPWYFFTSKAQNIRNCWLGNFKVPPDRPLCQANPPNGDGFLFTAPVNRYFPNRMGFCDVVGNAAEMTAEKGKACGGSWNHSPEESTIRSVSNYSGPDGAVGFRVFMEVIEK